MSTAARSAMAGGREPGVAEQRHHHVLERRERAQQVMELEDEADAVPAQVRECLVVELHGLVPVDGEHAASAGRGGRRD
jgi:hypothetical protein